MVTCLKENIKGYILNFISCELLISDNIQGTEINLSLVHKKISRKLPNEVSFSSLYKREKPIRWRKEVLNQG
jgi:hypothetical protein